MPGGLIAIDEKLQGGESLALFDFASEDLGVERLEQRSANGNC